MKIFLVVLLSLAVMGAAGRRRDPLTDEETEQLREVALEPIKRLRLYIKFSRARMMALEQTRSDPKLAEDRSKHLHDLLEDLGNIVDEMDDNVQSYDKQRADLRKPLKEVIEADSELQMKLRALKERATNDAAAAKEMRAYAFALENTIESVNASADGAREVLNAQNEAFAKAKEAEKEKEKEMKEAAKKKK